MKKWILILFSLAFVSCYSSRSLMTYEDFASIKIGSSAADVRSKYGEPYAIHSRGGNTDEWVYIERFDVGARVAAQRHYIVIFTNQKVVGKRVETLTPPPYTPTPTEDPFPHNG